MSPAETFNEPPQRPAAAITEVNSFQFSQPRERAGQARNLLLNVWYLSGVCILVSGAFTSVLGISTPILRDSRSGEQ